MCESSGNHSFGSPKLFQQLGVNRAPIIRNYMQFIAMKRFRHSVEEQIFLIFTDHKPLIFIFHEKPKIYLPQFSALVIYLDLIE